MQRIAIAALALMSMAPLPIAAQNPANNGASIAAWNDAKALAWSRAGVIRADIAANSRVSEKNKRQVEQFMQSLQVGLAAMESRSARARQSARVGIAEQRILGVITKEYAETERDKLDNLFNLQMFYMYDGLFLRITQEAFLNPLGLNVPWRPVLSEQDYMGLLARYAIDTRIYGAEENLSNPFRLVY